MKKIGLSQIFPLCTGLLAGVFLYLGIVKLGFWDEVKGPMGGFYPSLVSGILLVMSIAAFSQSWKETGEKMKKEEGLAALAAAGILAASYVIGMLTAVFLYLILWMKGVEKAGWKQTLTFTITVGGAVWLIFSVWLGIQFPAGLLKGFMG